MGRAEVIVLSEVRASTQWQELRDDLHTRFDQWLDRLEEQLPDPQTSLAEVTEAVWKLRQDLTGSLSETIVEQAHRSERSRPYTRCPQCGRRLKARPSVPRTVDTMVGPVQVERPYFYCTSGCGGVSPLDEALELAPGRKQLDVQRAAVQLAIELPYEEAQTVFSDLTGVALGSERLHTFTHQAAEGLTVLDVAPSRDAIERRIQEVAAGRFRRPVLVLGIDGAYVPTRPESARGRRPGQGRQRAKRAQWKGQWRDSKGFRFYLIDADRIVHVLGWHQVQNEAQLGQALKQVKDAGLIPEDQVRLCVVGDGASWIWKHVKSLFPSARQVLDYYHCKEYLHKVAKVHYESAESALEWVEATLTRLYVGKVGWVLGGLKRMKATSEEAAKAISNCWDYLDAHRDRTHYRQLRRGGYPIGSGGIESSNKFICHVRLKRSGAWWYELNSNQMLALRCAKYNGTFNRVFERYRQRLREA
jgi:DNA-directed RNA polymerase subunit RPC12/RpoP